MEDSAEAEGVVPTDSDGAEASQVGHQLHSFIFSITFQSGHICCKFFFYIGFSTAIAKNS